MVDYELPKVLVINLDGSMDRWQRVCEMCASVGITPIRVPAVKVSPGLVGCALSHIKCVNIAQNLNLPWVLVLEDDSIFTKESWERFISYLPMLWKRRDEWNYFNGGPTYMIRVMPFDEEHKMMEGGSLTSHFVLYNNRVYNTVKKWIPDEGPIDYYLKHKSSCVFTAPYVAYQITGESVIENRIVDYYHDFKKSEDFAINIINMTYKKDA